MILRASTQGLPWLISFLCILLCAAGIAQVQAQQQPQSAVSYFNNLPANLFFFDDTESAIYHDVMEGAVYVSQDEGKTWKMAEDIPKGEAAMVIEHPFNNKYAFVLTSSTTHYRTEDRGRTWRPFDVPIPPALVARPLSFHSDPAKYGYILYQGTKCDRSGWGAICHDETYYTKQAFSDTPSLLLSQTSRCQFAHSTHEFKHEAPSDLIYCVAFDTSSSSSTPTLSSSRLFSSPDFFQTTNKVEDLGIGPKASRGVVAFAIVSKFAVVALKDLGKAGAGEMLLYVSVDTKTWAKAQFPHASSAQLHENGYTLVESTTHSLAVDVVLSSSTSSSSSAFGTLFVSNSNGTFFVESLKGTNRNEMGYVDYERVYGVEGVGVANVVKNREEVEGRGGRKKVGSLITFDDGSSWTPLRAPATTSSCTPSTAPDSTCSLHLHSVTTPHNFGRIFSSPAPGFVMGVGSVGAYLLPYEESHTYLSTDAGVSWREVASEARKYEFGDKGSVLVSVPDSASTTKTVEYSLDLGKSWRTYELPFELRPRALTTLPDSTSQKFLLLASVAKKDRPAGVEGGVALVWLDFAGTRGRKCEEGDFEKWYARTGRGEEGKECLMGHKQWYKRRKPDADCYVGEKYQDPVEHEDNCECTDIDYECDYNYVRNGDTCTPVGPEPIPAGVCGSDPGATYKGSSGYRKIPGNTCVNGIKKDEKVDKKCSEAQPDEGEILHQTFEFQSQIRSHAYFKESKTILVLLNDHTMWQSLNEGYTWSQLFPGEQFFAFYLHKYSFDRAYIITQTETFYYTTDAGRTWHKQMAPTPPNIFSAQILRFHPTSDRLIWTGNRDCGPTMGTCHAEAQYSLDNGRNWKLVEKYVRNCAWAKDAELDTDPNEILCESYKDKTGDQRVFVMNPLELVTGSNFYGEKQKVFDEVVGFAKFSEYLVVAEMSPKKRSLDLQVSLDGKNFATGKFPPSMHPETHAYTVLESSTKSLFLHMTMSEPPAPYWGNILKSNSNGTYFGLSIQNVNRDQNGFVDFEKMIGLDGIALINVVANPEEAVLTGHKKLQSRITHNDGSTWKPLLPPKVDSLGQPYECNTAKCALHIHGYTERSDPRATYSTPSVVGLLMAVGNVGETLAPYKDSDTFLSRDAGFTWEEVRKDAHLWEFGDSGSILIMANDEDPTDHIVFSTDEGLNWREYKFTDEKMRVRSIVTVPSDTSRRFILFGQLQSTTNAVAVQIDFTALTLTKCVLDIETDPGHDDFELWSPSEEREERCLFGRQTLYHRRVRDKNCVVGDQPKAEAKVVYNCPCSKIDFECEFNYVKDDNDECVPVEGTTPLPDDASCRNGEDYWYERTAYRLIPYSSCEEGIRLDRGTRHVCPGFKSKGALFWMFVVLIPFAFTALVAYYYYRRSGIARGTIRLPGDGSRPSFQDDSGILGTLASVPWFLVGIAGIAFEWVTSRTDRLPFRQRRGYRDVPIDEDAQVLRFEDEE